MWQPLIFALLAAVPVVFGALPKGWQACSRSAPDYSNCIAKEMNHAVATLINGDKAIGLLPLDPLKIDSVKIPKSSGPVSVDMRFSDAQITGVKDIKFSSVKNDWKTMNGSAYIPKLVATGHYKVDGKVLVLPIVGEGKYNFTYDKLDMELDVNWKKSKINGKEVYQMEKFYIIQKPERLFIHFDNLFNGDKALGDQMNNFLNENWDSIFDELTPFIAEGLSQAFSQISNRIMSRIPADEVDIK